MTKSAINADLASGPDLCQGDLILTRLNDKWPAVAASVAHNDVIRRPVNGELRLLEGEVTGHHHAIRYGLSEIARFRDDGLARALTADAPVAIGVATLVRDPKATRALVAAKCLTRADLAIGFLIVERGPVDLAHPEHDAIRVPEGTYYVGRQIESAGAEERVVRD
jgi:hypothetical protein